MTDRRKFNYTAHVPERRARLTEAENTQQIRSVLKLAKIFHWKAWQGPMSQPKGVSDILGIWQGKFLAIEIKKQGWTPPAPALDSKIYQHYQRQKAFIDRVNEEGGMGFFATEVQVVIDKLELGFLLRPLFEGG